MDAVSRELAEGAGNWQGPLQVVVGSSANLAVLAVVLSQPVTPRKVPAEPGEHPLGLRESGRSDSRQIENHQSVVGGSKK